MCCEAHGLPTDIDELQALCRAQLQTIATLQAQIVELKEQVALLTAKRFGSSSEKQKEALSTETAVTATIELPEDTVEIPAHKRRRGGRRPLPDHLPRIDVVHELSEDEQVCPHDGHRRVVIGQETSEQLEFVPQQLRVLRHVRKKYGCLDCQIGVTTAPLPPQPIPKSLASPGLLAYLATAKCQDGLPLYRLERIFQRFDVPLTRATLASWMIALGLLLRPLITLLREEMLSYDIVGMDETTLQVLKEPDRPATSKSYLWVQRGGPPKRPIILFDYAPTRSQSVPLQLLEGFQGYLSVDGYEGYEGVGKLRGIYLKACWAHARRKFDEALKAQVKLAVAEGQLSHARQAMNVIQALYRIERKAKLMTPEERYELRQAKAKPIIEDFRHWLDQVLPTLPPTSLTGKAIRYVDNQWTKLIRYLEDGRLSIDNNLLENTIRPFVIGRKAWLFCDTVKGAEASAIIYSIIETAKANGHEPYFYLRHVIAALPKAKTIEDLEALLPYNLTPDQVSRI